MHFHTEHLIHGVSLKDYEQAFFDEGLNNVICEALRMHRTLVSRSVSQGRLQRCVEVHPERGLPGPLAKLVEASRIRYTEKMSYAFGSFEGAWTIEPGLMADKITCYGVVRFLPHDAGVIRQVEGDVEVRLFGVGKIAERFIVEDIERSFAQAVGLTERWLSERARTTRQRRA